MGPCLLPEEVSALGPGQPPTQAQQAHLAQCERCREAWRVGLERTLSTGDGGAGGGEPSEVEAVPVEPPGRYQRVRGADGKLELLGRGGYGHVLLVEDTLVGRKVALKELRAAQRASPRRAIVEQRLLQEARVVGQLEHPSIVPLYDLARSADGALFYVMRQIRGRTLADAIRAAATLDERLRLLPHVLAACNAVAYAHARGVLHRDLKPQNVMVDRFGETLVIDWGLAHASGTGEDGPDSGDEEGLNLVATDETIGEGRGRVGTPAYMSPEQLAGDRARLDALSDVFGLGAILYEVLTGRAPREDGPLHAPVPEVRSLAPDVPADLAALCDKALAPSRERRYPSAQALADDLDAWLHGRRVQAHVYRPWELLKRFVLEHRYTVAVATAALVLLAALGVAAALRVRDERNRARDFAVLLASDVVDRLPITESTFRTDISRRVGEWLSANPSGGDLGLAAWVRARIILDFDPRTQGPEALAAARECLAYLRANPGADPRFQAARLLCELIELEAELPVGEERRTALQALWDSSLPGDDTSSELVVARAYVAQSLQDLATNLVDNPAEHLWATRLERLARRQLELKPASALGWQFESFALRSQGVAALNANDGRAALPLLQRAVAQARLWQGRQMSLFSLTRMVSALQELRAAQRFFPELTTEEERTQTARELRRALEAAITIRPWEPVTRDMLVMELLQDGDLAAARATDAEDLQRSLEYADASGYYLSVFLGRGGKVVDWLTDHPALHADVDRQLAWTLAEVERGAWAEGAKHLRLAASVPFVSDWPVDASVHWAAQQQGAAAELLRRFVAALSQAQRHNDAAAAAVAFETYARALDALAASAR